MKKKVQKEKTEKKTGIGKFAPVAIIGAIAAAFAVSEKKKKDK